MLKLQTSLLVVFVLVPMPACADWPLFRGNERQDGVARTTLPDVLEVKWKIKLEDGIESTAAIVKDTAYVGCFDQHLYALDLKNGAVQWKYKAGPIKAPVAYREGMLFVGDEDGLFHCVDAAKGTKIWTFQTGNEISAGANFSGDKILVGSHDSHLYCLDQKGKETWKFKIEGGPVMATPVVAGKLTFVAGCDSMMHFIDLEKGTGLAKIELGGQVGASAAVLGNHAYVGTMTNDFKALDLTKKEVIWNVESKKEQPFHASAAVKDDVVVTGGRDRLVYAFDRVKGTVLWTFATRNRVDSSPVIVGKRVVVGSADGSLYVLDLVKGTQVQKLELGRSVLASPAVAQECVIIGTTDGWLYCLGKER